jgi:excinuclease ABC subunit C
MTLAEGVETLWLELKTMPGSPGVYRMLDAKGEVLYVGKAKNLKKRVVAYTRVETLPVRLQRMVARTVAMEIVVTHTEADALLLEANLIKQFRPHFNILLKDDKSFPYILITGHDDWPRLTKHRGARDAKGDYFGPFASAGAVNQTLDTLQRAFLLRTCSDSVFANRSRPCLLFQIKRCAGPCAGRIGKDDYGRLIGEARSFLSGKSQDVKQILASRMEEASEALEFESAAMFRDRLKALARIQSHQGINLPGLSDADVVAIHQTGGRSCVQVFFFRGGQNYGTRAYFPAHAEGDEEAEVLGAFLGQFYADRPPPPLLLLSQDVPERALLAQALGLKAGRKVEISVPRQGEKRAAVLHALTNAREALERRLAENAIQTELLERVSELFQLEGPPSRIEVYDNSHVMGAHAVGAMIVAGPEGLAKNAYRKFNIKSSDMTPGDDFAMMREVLTRRFQRARKEDPLRDQGLWPDLVLIDGGKGQLRVTLETLAELGIEDLPVAAISKGADRNAGREWFHMAHREPFQLPLRDPVLHFLQRLRDEAHRFAIGTHRAKRSQALSSSPLDAIEGIGARRKKALLHHFGSAAGVSEAGLADLEAVAGISRAMAKKLYDHFHSEG